MHTRKKISLVFLLINITSCSTNETIKKLSMENDSLQEKVTSYQGKVAELEIKLRENNLKIEELNVLSSNLSKEKKSRIEESSTLRAEIRQFIRREMDDFRDFFKDSDISDYIGGELIDRSTVSDSNMTIVDFSHAFPKKGRLLGATVRVSKPTTFSVLVFRPVADQLIVLWKSEQFSVMNRGINKVGFELDVTVEKGDLLGFSFPQNVGISYNQGTGDTGLIEGQLQPGKLIKTSQISNRNEKRSYSLGVYGFFAEN